MPNFLTNALMDAGNTYGLAATTPLPAAADPTVAESPQVIQAKKAQNAYIVNSFLVPDWNNGSQPTGQSGAYSPAGPLLGNSQYQSYGGGFDMGNGPSGGPAGVLGGWQMAGKTPAAAPTTGATGSTSTLGGDWSGVEQWDSLINQSAAKYGLDPNMIKALMKLESNGDPNAGGAPGVVGVMQVYTNVWGNGPWEYDTAANIDKGAEILKSYLDSAGGDYYEALRGYHGYGSDGYTTDTEYADIVMGNYNQLKAGGTGSQYGTVGGSSLTNNQVVQQALQYVGTQYVWGGIPGKGQDPRATGWDTVHEDTDVLMADGSSKKIKHIEPDDRVMTYTSDGPVPASVRMVYKKGVKAMMRIETTRTIHRTTPNHPFLVHDAKKRVSSMTEASALNELDMLVAVRPAVSESPEPDTAWIVGLMVGNGNLNGKNINLCVYGEIRERASAILARITGNTPGHDEKHGIYLSCREFTDWLASIGLNVHAHEKRVPDVVWRWDDASRDAFLLGYLQTDGSLCDTYSYAVSSASRELTVGIRDLAASLGHKVSGYRKQERTKPIVIKGKTVKDAKPIYWSRIRVEPNDTAYPWDFVSVTSVRNDDPAPAYDLSIDHPSETFIVDGVVAHNCSGMTYWLDQNYGSGALPMGSHYQYQYAQQTGQLFNNTAQLQPGDLLFWDTGNYAGGGAELNAAGHVGVYIGNGQMLHAANPTDGTIISDFNAYTQMYGFLGAMHSSYSGGTGGTVAGGTSAPVKDWRW